MQRLRCRELDAREDQAGDRNGHQQDEKGNPSPPVPHWVEVKPSSGKQKDQRQFENPDQPTGETNWQNQIGGVIEEKDDFYHYGFDALFRCYSRSIVS